MGPMSLAASVTDSSLDLPPPYELITLREAGDAFAHACAIAGQRGAGTLIWVRRDDVAEFAVVLEPEEPLSKARRAIYAGMNAMAEALAVHAPPSRPTGPMRYASTVFSSAVAAWLGPKGHSRMRYRTGLSSRQ